MSLFAYEVDAESSSMALARLAEYGCREAEIRTYEVDGKEMVEVHATFPCCGRLHEGHAFRSNRICQSVREDAEMVVDAMEYQRLHERARTDP